VARSQHLGGSRILPRLARLALWGLAFFVAVAVLAAILAVAAAGLRETAIRQTLAPLSGRFVRAHDIELYVQEAGPAGGHVVVLVHGTGAWSEIWRETMQSLADHGYRAVAVDMPPFGFSERPAANDYTTATQGRRLADLLTRFDRAVTVVGHSFGARATIESVMVAPGRVRALVLVDAALGLHAADGSALPDADDPPGAISTVLAIGLVRRPLVAALLTNPMMTRLLLQQLISRTEAATPARVEMLQRPLALAGSTTALGAWLQWFVHPDRPPRSGRIASYRTLRIPTVVIWGATDSVTPLAQGRAIASLFGAGRLRVLENTGHIPAIESPAEFNGALLEFLTSLTEDPRAQGR
jgi:pimeloyl-ACP methyl ester carboxylesterase